MTVEELIKTIHSLYLEAHKPFYQHDRIFRGEARPIPSLVEDLFAKYLIEILPSEIVLYINQLITSNSVGDQISVKPDIVIVRNDEIKAIIDVKMDLGYKRKEFPIFWDERDDLIPKMRNQTFSFNESSDGTKIKLYRKFSHNAKLYFVIISDKNISAKLLGEVQRRVGAKKYSNLYFLLDGIHPNSTKTTLDILLTRVDSATQTMDQFLSDLQNVI